MVRCVGRETHFLYETVSVDDAIVCVLKIVRKFVSRLIQLDVIRAGHDHHDDAAVLELLDRTSEPRSFGPQLADRRIDVVAHQRDRVVTRVIVRLASHSL
jgi:chemotaxis regulatin CheY-phosphate phosphatase CheZ